MKKVLAVLLTVMMLFATVSMSASAAYNEYYEGEFAVADPETQAIFVFDLNGGKLRDNVWVWDSDIANFVNVEGPSVENPYIMLPRNDEMHKAGGFITLPVVTAPEGYQFDGWYCISGSDKGSTYAAGGNYTIPADAIGDVVQFKAGYSPTSIEPDTLDTVLGILIKIFGAIIGIVLYSGNTEAGVALMEQVLGGLF